MKTKHLCRIVSAALTVLMAASSLITTVAEGTDSVIDLASIKVTQTLNSNDGTTLNQVYSYSAASTTLGAPALTVSSVSIQKAAHDLQKQGTGAFSFGKFPHAGEYDYTLSQVALNPSVGSGLLTGDQNTYLLKVMVSNTESGPTIKEIHAVDNGSGVKVNENGISFVSTYVRPGGATASDGHALVIANTVNGEYADKTKQFSVSIKFAAPATNTMADGSPYDPTRFQVHKGGDAIPVDAGGVVSFTLADGESAVFDNIPAGTSYFLRQKIEQGYSAQALVLEDGHENTYSCQPEEASLSASGLNISEGTNHVSLTNDMQSIEVTGVSLDWIPYAAMILCAAAAVLIYERLNHHEAG